VYLFEPGKDAFVSARLLEEIQKHGRSRRSTMEALVSWCPGLTEPFRWDKLSHFMINTTLLMMFVIFKCVQ
jgi:hypothetical protein